MSRINFSSKLSCLFLGLGWILFSTANPCRGDNPPPSPDSPGCIFIRERSQGLPAFLKAFEGQKASLKATGFNHYSLHEDIQDPRVLILVLGCSSLEKGLAYLESPAYRDFLTQAGAREVKHWSGVDVLPRDFGRQAPKPAGMVIAWGTLKSFDRWKAFFDSEHDPAHGGKNPSAGKGYHPNRDYTASSYSIHRGLGKPDSAIVAHQASDIRKAPEFMRTIPMENIRKPMGLLKMEVWFGYNLESGDF